MQNSGGRRRFIAGAVCPRCALMDKVVVDLDSDQRVCVSCGFSEERPGVPAVGPGSVVTPESSELATRVSRAAARRVETPAEAITLIDTEKDRDMPLS
jgi:uncharacterized metal-binding protein (TIGR02443 family)